MECVGWRIGFGGAGAWTPALLHTRMVGFDFAALGRAAAFAAALTLAACQQPTLAAREESFEFSVEPYRSSAISVDGNGVSVTRTGQGGVGVRLRLGSQGWGRRYVIETEPLGRDDLRLRLTRPEGFRYIAPEPDRPLRFVIGGPVTQGLLYSETAEHFEFRVAGITDCARGQHDLCYTTENLRDEALGESPPDEPFARLLALLNWAANAADYAATAELAQEAGYAVNRYRASQMYASYYRHNRAAGFCGATANFFANMLRELDYEAVSVDFGVADTRLTHVTTIVRNPGDGEFYLLDPTFNFHIIRRDTRAPATYREVLTLPPEQLEFVEMPMLERDYLVPEADYRADRRRARAGGARLQRCRLRGAVYVCRDPDFDVDRFIADSASAMEAAGFPATREGFILMLRGRYFRVTGPESTRQEIIALLAGAGIEEPRRY